MPATETIQLRLTPEDRDALDRLRGQQTRSGLLRGLLRGALDARERAGAPCELFVVHEGER